VLRFANACGAITTTKKGAIPALPTDIEALSFLKDQKKRQTNLKFSKWCCTASPC